MLISSTALYLLGTCLDKHGVICHVMFSTVQPMFLEVDVVEMVMGIQSRRKRNQNQASAMPSCHAQSFSTINFFQATSKNPELSVSFSGFGRKGRRNLVFLLYNVAIRICGNVL